MLHVGLSSHSLNGKIMKLMHKHHIKHTNNTSMVCCHGVQKPSVAKSTLVKAFVFQKGKS